ncbi:MAG: hypothetical protein ABWY26_04295 [Microbacterium sp.]
MALLADAPVLVRPGALLRALPRETTASQAGIATAAVLGIGIIVSMVTTPDPLWWQLHFSRLGTFAVFSGYVFNATIVMTSAGVVVFALRLRREMRRHAGTPVLTNRRAATVVPILVGLLGIHLSFVGFVPVNANEFIHDRGSTGAVLMFILILASSRWMLRGMHRVMARTTRWVSLGLVATVAPYIGGFINLAAFELIVFSLVFYWLLLFARTVGRPADRPARPVAIRTGSMQRTVIVAARDRAEHVAVVARGALPAQSRMRGTTRPRGVLHVQRRASLSGAARQPDPEHPRARRLHTIRA